MESSDKVCIALWHCGIHHLRVVARSNFGGNNASAAQTRSWRTLLAMAKRGIVRIRPGGVIFAGSTPDGSGLTAGPC